MDLRPGDVILLRSPGKLAAAVRLLDGAEVDRAALYLGGDRVAEALETGAVARPLAECVASAEHVVARRLKDAAAGARRARGELAGLGGAAALAASAGCGGGRGCGRATRDRARPLPARAARGRGRRAPGTRGGRRAARLAAAVRLRLERPRARA